MELFLTLLEILRTLSKRLKLTCTYVICLHDSTKGLTRDHAFAKKYHFRWYVSYYLSWFQQGLRILILTLKMKDLCLISTIYASNVNVKKSHFISLKVNRNI